MAIRDLTSERLYLGGDLALGLVLDADEAQAHYLTGVLRLKEGDKILVFNGRDGEWAAAIKDVKKRKLSLQLVEQVRPQEAGPDLIYLFAPLKRARLDYMVQKATELGARVLQPVMTERTVAERVNLERMRANVVEAAEQCGILEVPEVREPVALKDALEAWDSSRPLIFCDEEAPAGGPLASLEKVPKGPFAVLVGPEGGFSPGERQSLLGKSFVVTISLGPRIMRADTAAVAALALANSVLGDWRV